MNRRIAAWTIAAVAVLGLTACSGGSADAPDDEPAASAPSSATETEDTSAGEQSVSEACLSLAEPMQAAATTMSELSTASSDPQSAVDAWTALVDAYKSGADSITNAEVNAAVTTVYEDTSAVRDALSKIYVDGDTGAMAELTTATTDMQTSSTALTSLCAG